MRHLILLLIFSILLAKVHSEVGPDYAPFLQDEPFLQDHEISNEEVNYDDSFDLFTEDLTANPSNNCFSYDDVDNIFLTDVARLRLRRETCANLDAPTLILPTDIYDSNSVLNLLSAPPNSPVISGPKKEEPNYLDLERLFGLPLPAPKQKDENDECPADLYGDSRIPVCEMGSFVRDVEMPAGELHCTVYNVRIYGKLDPCVDNSASWCCAIVRSAHHPLDSEQAPDVLTGYRCLDLQVMGWIKEINRLSPGGYSIEQLLQGQHRPYQKRLGEEPGFAH